jgi:hypothetical protein
MYHTSFQNTLEAPWRNLSPIRLGQIPPGLPEPHRWVTVERDGVPLARIDVYAEYLGAFEELIVWHRWAVIGLGSSAHLVDPVTRQTHSVACDSYFGHLYPLQKHLLIASDSALQCLDEQGELVWRREHLGLDGVLVHEVADGVIKGEGEWDPPGGWQPFQLSLANGASLPV